MKFLAFLSLFITVVLAATNPPPACVLACVNENSANLTCNSMRLSCICASGLNVIAPCLKTKCASANAASATTYFQSQCADGGFTVQLRDVNSASGTAGSGSNVPSGTSGTKSSSTGAAASGTSKSAADKIILSTSNSGAFLGLAAAIVFGLLAI